MDTTDTTDTPVGVVTAQQIKLVDRLAVCFYALAATMAAIAQVWGITGHLPETLPSPARLALAVAAAVALEFFAVIFALLADLRMRLGEQALLIRVCSAAVATVATAVILWGHQSDPYIAIGFATLSAGAYCLALIHMAARRRDALRAAGLLAQVPPAYGLYRRLRHPVLTARAAELARVQGLGLREALRQAELELRAERRRPAIAAAVEAAIRSSHDDPRMAEIAVSTLDLDRIAEELAATADYAGWAARLAPAVTAPEPDTAPDMSAPETGHEADMSSGHEADIGADTAPDMSGQRQRTSPGVRIRRQASRPVRNGRQKADKSSRISAAELQRLRDQHPDITQAQLAKLAGVSDRTVRRILNGAKADMSAPEPDMDGGHVRLNGYAVSG